MPQPSPTARLATLLLLLALGGGVAAATQSAPAASAPAAAPTKGETQGLTPDLVYAVLVGQVARQRGDHRMAVTHFLHAAKLAGDPGLAEQAARSALALGDAELIQRTVDTWLEIAPNSISAYQIAAYTHLEAQDLAGAIDHLRRLIRLSAEAGEDGFVRAARLAQKLKAPEQRVELMEILTAGEPQNPDGWFARAMVAAGAERHEDAVAAAERALELRPDWNEPRVFLIQLYLSRGERQKARDALASFVDQTPDERSLRTLYAQMLVEDEEFERAREVFSHLLKTEPKEPDVLFALGILSLQLEDLDAARDYFGRLRETGERRDESAYYLGQAEELADNAEAAIGWYEKVSGEHSLDAQVRIARLQARGGQVEAARERLHRLRDRVSGEAVTLYLIEAEILRDVDLKREAMAVYDGAIAQYPDDPDLLYSRALHALAFNRLDILEQDLRQIIAKDPEHADALNALGYSLADLTDRYQEAYDLVARALALKPDDAAVLDSMGWVLFRLGRLDEAEGYLRRALDLSSDGEIAAHLGELLWARGERDGAWRVWEEALAKDPKHEYLLRVIGRHRVTSNDGGSR